jgi:hypothetical protein
MFNFYFWSSILVYVGGSVAIGFSRPHIPPVATEIPCYIGTVKTLSTLDVLPNGELIQVPSTYNPPTCKAP